MTLKKTFVKDKEVVYFFYLFLTRCTDRVDILKISEFKPNRIIIETQINL